MKNGLGLPYQEWIRLKKMAQRWERRNNMEEERAFVIATLNEGTMTGRGEEVVDVMERKKIDMLRVQETRGIRKPYKLYYMGVNNRKNGASVVLSQEIKEGVVQMNKESDRLMWLKIEVAEKTINVAYAYALQVG